MKRVLIFVLSAHIHPWQRMIGHAKATWDAGPLEGTETIYYSGQPQTRDEDRVWQFPIDEHYSTMGHKNLLAYEKALTLPWDYMARVHSSCYVHKARLLTRCQELPTTGLLQGIVLGPTEVCGTDRPWMWGGGHFVFSRDVIQTIVDHRDRWRHHLMEDVATSEIVQDLGLSLNGEGRSCSLNKQEEGKWLVLTYGGLPSVEFTDFNEINKVNDQYFFRVKNDPDRRVDFEAMKLLKRHLQ